MQRLRACIGDLGEAARRCPLVSSDLTDHLYRYEDAAANLGGWQQRLWPTLLRLSVRSMKIILTGSSGRVGRAIYNQLAPQHEVIGIDRTPFATTRLVADFADANLLAKALPGADAIIHTAALHAPHVGVVPDSEFERINVEGTRLVVEAAQLAGVPRLVFTSTTALFGQAMENGRAAWVTDDTPPRPRSIYHRSKLAAEALLQAAAGPTLAVRVLRMARCFPEAADLMALYRLSRGVDVRDVASAHVAALSNGGPAHQCYIISGQVPFLAQDLG